MKLSKAFSRAIGKRYLWVPLILTLIITMTPAIVPVHAGHTNEYFWVEPAMKSGVNPGTVFKVEVGIANAWDMVGWALSVHVNPDVLEVLNVTEGPFLFDWLNATYPLEVEWELMDTDFLLGSVNKTVGYINDTSCQIQPWSDIPDGEAANGTGILCECWFKSKNLTAYSLIDLFDVRVYDHHASLYIENVTDGNYNTPAVQMHDVAVTAITAPAEATQPDVVTVDVDLANEGNVDEVAELKVSIDGTVFFAKELTLSVGASVKESASLDTIIVGAVSDPTSYTIRAEAELAAGIVDANPADNWNETSILINPGPVGCIKGTVIDAGTLDPIEGATVTANGYSTITDADGYYLMGVAPENYTVTASKDGYATASELDVSVAAGTNVIVDFALSSLFYRVDLVKRSAWPEHHSFSIGGDEDDYINLYAIIRNVGDQTTEGKVNFTITPVVGLPDTVETSAYSLGPGDTYGSSKDYFAQWKPTGTGIWYVTAKAWYKDDGGAWQESPDKPKTFKFTVKP